MPVLSRSEKLAAALAERLSRVVPQTFSVRADGGAINLYYGGALLCSSRAPEFVDEEDSDSTWGERVEPAALAALGDLQDCLAEQLTEPWPPSRGDGMALPGTRSDGIHLHLWYGGDEKVPTIGFPPIVIAEIGILAS